MGRIKDLVKAARDWFRGRDADRDTTSNIPRPRRRAAASRVRPSAGYFTKRLTRGRMRNYLRVRRAIDPARRKRWDKDGAAWAEERSSRKKLKRGARKRRQTSKR